MMSSKFKSEITVLVFAIGVICFAAEVDAQGLRIGKLRRAGNGQGFRTGGQQAGGGQGARVGCQNCGTQFAGQQFRGQQVAQTGRVSAVTVVRRETYYYKDVNRYSVVNGRPVVQLSLIHI